MRVLKVPTYILLAALAVCELSHNANAAETAKVQTDRGANKAAPLHPRSSVPVHVSTRASDLLAQATTFSDIQSNWAQSFIQALAARNIIQGFPDGSFRPDEPVTRAQFAAMVRKAFQQNPVRKGIEFVDVPVYYWASEAIQEAYQTGFLAGYPNGVFNPNQNIPRVQVLVALANGLNLSARETTALDTYFQDASQIPKYARNSVAAAVEKSIVVNYPTVKLLNPNQIATRADVAAFIYQALASTGAVSQLPASASVTQYVVGFTQQTASTPPPTDSTTEAPPAADIKNLQSQLLGLQQGTGQQQFGNVFRGSPSITVANPTGFGADNNTLFSSVSYQTDNGDGFDDGAAGFGFGFGNSRRAVGVELSYTLASVTGEATEFGRGGFNLKVHRQLPGNFAVAVGYNGFLNIGDTDFEDSIYGVATKIFRTRRDIRSPFSRVAVSAGLGSGQFRTGDDFENDNDSVNVFGSLGVRVIQPVSLIAEWTGQDLALGASIVPFRNSSFVITPAVRDIAGDGDGARFVLGTGFSLQF